MPQVKRHKFKGVRVNVEAPRGGKKHYTGIRNLLDLSFVDHPDDERPVLRVLYMLGTIGCVLMALIGAVLPVFPAIPFWTLAVVCLSHAVPAFGRFARSTRIYQWLLRKLDEPVQAAKRPVMERSRKDAIAIGVSVALGAVWLLCFFVAPLPKGGMWVVSAAVTIVFAVMWFVLFTYVRDTEATIRTRRRRRRG